MFLKLIRITTIYLFVFFILPGYSFSSPELNIPTNMTVSNDTQVIIPINITGVSGAGIVGYSVRIDFDDANLTNPVVITDDTLSEGEDVKGGPPQDGKGGKYLITLFSGFSASEDGVLIKLQLDIDTNFSSTNISFVSEETKLFNSTYRLITYSSSDGLLMRFDSEYENDVITIGKKDDDEVFTSEDGFLKMETDSFNGDGFIVSGHNAEVMTFSVNGPESYQMLSRSWFFEVYENKPDFVTLTFTIPDMPASVQHFALLKASDNSSFSNFAELKRPISVGQNTIEFQLSSEELEENNYYTIGFIQQQSNKVAIPTLNEWGMILFAGLLILMSIAKIKEVRIDTF